MENQAIKPPSELTESEMRSEIADACGAVDWLASAEEKIGLCDREQTALRVRWVNALRAIVGRRMPKNNAGAALTTDVDLLQARPIERAEALVVAIRWKEALNLLKP